MITIKAPVNKGNYQPIDFGLITFAYPASGISATTNSTSTVTFTSPNTTAGLAIGMTVIGSNIPSGAKITAIPSSSTITISSNATGTGSTSLSFSITTRQIDEIIISGVSEIDPNGIVFIKRYSTWLAYTYTKGGNFIYNITFLSYDRTNQIAYTFTDKIRIVTLA
jgi:hypothetical protein